MIQPRRPSPWPLVWLLVLAGSACEQVPPPKAGEAWAPLPPPGTTCPSIVPEPTTGEGVSLGRFPLEDRRPAVVDGDTIRVKGLAESLRLVGIDTEETFKDKGRRRLAERNWKEYLALMYAGTTPGRPPKFGTPMGEAARRFAERFFAGVKTVRLEHDDPRRRVGYFGRRLVHVLARKDGRWVNFNVETVRQGLSPYFVKYGRCHRYHGAFVAAEAEARAAGRGIWAAHPRHACYPDYPQRLAWWRERADDLETVARLRKKDPDLFVLGDDADWERLKRMKGRSVTVAGSPGRLVRRRGLAIQYLGHRRGEDLAIVGPPRAVEGLELKKEEGNILLVSGIVSLHRGRPQFRVETVLVRHVSEPAAAPDPSPGRR